jgi:hypothetical protein
MSIDVTLEILENTIASLRKQVQDAERELNLERLKKVAPGRVSFDPVGLVGVLVKFVTADGVQEIFPWRHVPPMRGWNKQDGPPSRIERYILARPGGIGGGSAEEEVELFLPSTRFYRFTGRVEFTGGEMWTYREFVPAPSRACGTDAPTASAEAAKACTPNNATEASRDCGIGTPTLN